MKKKKILLVGPFPPTVGGITSILNTIYSSSLNHKYEITPFTTSRPTTEIIKDINDYSILFHIGYSNLIKSLLITINHMIKLPFILMIKKPDIVHLHTSDYFTFWESLIYIILLKIFRKKVILHIHAHSFNKFYEAGGNAQKKAITITLMKVDRVVVLSHLQKEFFKKILPKDRLTVIYNSIDINMIDKHLINYVKNDDEIKVIFIGGTEAKRKGIYDIFKAIPIVINNSKDKIVFVFIGECEIDKLKDICKKNNVSDYVKFLGFVEEKEKYNIMESSNIFILPSYAEGLPIAILEAMYVGLPVISTSVGSIPEVIKNDYNGYLIEPGDFRSLADRIIHLSSNKRLREKIGNNNKEKIIKNYNINSFIDKLENLYNALL